MKDKAGADSCARLVKSTGYAGNGKLWLQTFVCYIKKLLCAKLYVKLLTAHK